MERDTSKDLWRKMLAAPSVAGFEEVARSIVENYSNNERFREHIADRSKRVTERTGIRFDPDNFDIQSARAYVADEIGFTSWEKLVDAVEAPGQKPILFHYTIAAMERGDFTALEEAIGRGNFHDQIVEWFENNYFASEPHTLDEIFAAACMLGYADTADYLLDKGVDPYAGMKTGLSGFHYAASSGRLEVVKLLIDRGVPTEIKNIYGGTVLDQAIWSAVNEHSIDHAAIVEALVEAGAVVETGYSEWWEKQEVPNLDTKERIAKVLARDAEFHKRISEAENDLATAETQNDKRLLADSLKALGNILRRPRFSRDQANAVYERAANIYSEIGLPLEAAWVKRHIGINHEYAERLEDAEKYYDDSLALFREHASEDDNNYANTVRYPAVVKNLLGKREESRALWEEACRRYENVHPNGLGEGVAEAAAWLTVFAIERGDLANAEKWFAKADDASSRSSDSETHKFVDQIRARLETAKGAKPGDSR